MYGKGQRELPVEPTHSRLVAMHTGVLGALVIHSFFPELHMVQDSSVDFHDTWDFLGRRMEDSAALSQARKQVNTQWAQFHGQEVLLHWVIQLTS